MITSCRIKMKFYILCVGMKIRSDCMKKERRIYREKHNKAFPSSNFNYVLSLSSSFSEFLSKQEAKCRRYIFSWRCYRSWNSQWTVTKKRNATTSHSVLFTMFFTSSKIQLHWITRRSIASSPCNKRTRRRQRGYGRSAASAIHVR